MGAKIHFYSYLFICRGFYKIVMGEGGIIAIRRYKSFTLITYQVITLKIIIYIVCSQTKVD